jgi:hypothetical protein
MTESAAPPADEPIFRECDRPLYLYVVGPCVLPPPPAVPLPPMYAAAARVFRAMRVKRMTLDQCLAIDTMVAEAIRVFRSQDAGFDAEFFTDHCGCRFPREDIEWELAHEHNVLPTSATVIHPPYANLNATGRPVNMSDDVVTATAGRQTLDFFKGAVTGGNRQLVHNARVAVTYGGVQHVVPADVTICIQRDVLGEVRAALGDWSGLPPVELLPAERFYVRVACDAPAEAVIELYLYGVLQYENPGFNPLPASEYAPAEK